MSKHFAACGRIVALGSVGLLATTSLFAQSEDNPVRQLSEPFGEITAIISSTIFNAPGDNATEALNMSRGSLVVPSVHPGTYIQQLAAYTRATEEKKSGPKPDDAVVEKLMCNSKALDEEQIQKLGFPTRDLEVAMAFTFLRNYEVGTGSRLPDQVRRAVMGTVAMNLSRYWTANFAKLPDSTKEMLYEFALFTGGWDTIVPHYQAEGNKTELANTHSDAALFFQILAGVPANSIAISPSGQMSFSQKLALGGRDGELDAVYVHSVWTTGPGGFIIAVWKPFLIFKDGAVYDNPEVSTDWFDRSQSEKQEPQHWRTIHWNSPKTATIMYRAAIDKSGNREAKFNNISRLIPSPKGLRLEGTFSWMTGSGNLLMGGNLVVASTTSYTFSPDGRFYRGGFAGGFVQESVSQCSRFGASASI
jgi:hypothetical protein